MEVRTEEETAGCRAGEEEDSAPCCDDVLHSLSRDRRGTASDAVLGVVLGGAILLVGVVSDGLLDNGVGVVSGRPDKAGGVECLGCTTGVVLAGSEAGVVFGVGVVSGQVVSSVRGAVVMEGVRGGEGVRE